MKKKVLIFIDWYLPGYKAGGPVQSVSNMVAHLKDEFDFSVVTRDTDYCETEPYKEIKSDQWNVREDGTRVYYFSKDKLTRAAISELIRSEEFEIAYLNGIFSLNFTLWPLYYLRKQKDKKIIIAARGMFAESALNVRRFKKSLFLFAIKKTRFFYDVIFHVTTEKERSEVEQVLGKRMHIMIAGNLPAMSSGVPPAARIKTGVLRLVNIARVAPEKNLLFALRVLRNVTGAIQFDCYGPVYDEGYWKDCLEMIRQLPPNIRVEYKGSVESEKVPDLLQQYHFMFMPTRGENFGHIILQSLCAGVPVIISDQTPWNKLKEKKAGWAIPLELEETYTKVISHCAEMDAEMYRNISAAAYAYGKEYVSDKNTLDRNRQLFIL